MLGQTLLSVGEGKRAKRIWLQGSTLEDAEFMPGQTYRVVVDEEARELTLEVDPSAGRVVSRKQWQDRTLPVIDLTNSIVTNLFGEARKVLAKIFNRRIVISLHRDEQDRIERRHKWQAVQQEKRSMQVGGICYGAGVIDHAVHDGLAIAGVKAEQTFVVELEDKYLEVARRNNPTFNPKARVFSLPMQDVEPSELGQADLIVCGIPCTGASRAGKSKNGIKHAEEHAKAGTLFMPLINMVRAANPFAVLIENVPEYQNSLSALVIRETLSAWGYVIKETVLEGQDFGSFERRRRYCMVAHIPEMTVNLDDLAKAPRMQRLSDILESSADEPLAANWNTFPYLKAKEQRDMAAGKGFKRQELTGDATSCGTIGREYHKCRSTEPFVVNPDNPDELRLLTPREHARVKTIPEYFVDGLVQTLAHQILGQSVIFNAFRAVGEELGRAINSKAIELIETAAERRTTPAETGRVNKVPASAGQLAMNF